MCSILNHLCCNAARHSDVLMLIDFDAPLARTREIAGVNARGMCLVYVCVCVHVCVQVNVEEWSSPFMYE